MGIESLPLPVGALCALGCAEATGPSTQGVQSPSRPGEAVVYHMPLPRGPACSDLLSPAYRCAPPYLASYGASIKGLLEHFRVLSCLAHARQVLCQTELYPHLVNYPFNRSSLHTEPFEGTWDYI